MKSISPSFRKISATALLVSFLVGVSFTGSINAQDNRHSSPAVSEQKVKVSSDLLALATERNKRDKIATIIQLDGSPSRDLANFVAVNRIHIKGAFKAFKSFAVDLPAHLIDELASFDEVTFISQDSKVETLGHVSKTTGADAVRNQTPSTGTPYLLNGTGIGIAVLDSGIDSSHKALVGTRRSRQIITKNFTGEGALNDPFGHGTHVASVVGGTNFGLNYEGVAPNATLLNLTVLNSHGSGSVSNVLSALDWVMTNRATHNIRIVNMSLGTRAVMSYRDDPLCKAVRRLVDAGIVVVVAAGNEGKDASGRKVYGQIHSPGNEPSAITVGASNTYGTDDRSDDTMTTYSSRGPTRSFSTDASGIRRYDNQIKPDLVAPGNKIIAAESDGNFLVNNYPNLNSQMNSGENIQAMYLSGTSMAAPVVAGAAALMLQANPTLTPNLIKTLLMYSAQQLPNANIFEQGAGQLNIEGAVRLANLVRTDLTRTTLVGAPLLRTSALPQPETTIAGFTFLWAGRINVSYTFANGTELITKFQKVYGTGLILSDGIILGDGIMLSDGMILADGMILGDGIMLSDGIILGDGFILSDGMILGDGQVISDGMILGDGIMLSDGIILSDARVRGASVLAFGDDTDGMD